MDPGLGEQVEKLKIEGIGTVAEPRRTYPQGELAGPADRQLSASRTRA